MRVKDSQNPWGINTFIIQAVFIALAPVFMMAGIYYILTQLVVVYGEKFSLMSARKLSYYFLIADFISLNIQGCGSGMTTGDHAQIGTYIMVGGLAVQVLTMSVFMYLFVDFLIKIKYLRKSQVEINHLFDEKFEHLRSKRSMKILPLGVIAGTLLVFVRSIFRLIEMSMGDDSYLMLNEIYFLILDAAMMSIVLVIFVILHPGPIMGREVIVQKFKKDKKDSHDNIEAESSIVQMVTMEEAPKRENL